MDLSIFNVSTLFILLFPPKKNKEKRFTSKFKFQRDSPPPLQQYKILRIWRLYSIEMSKHAFFLLCK